MTRSIHEVVPHEDLPRALERLGIYTEEDLQEAIERGSLKGKLDPSDLAHLQEIADPRYCD